MNIKWGIIGGAFALILSLAVGLVNGAGFLPALIRAFIFAAVFFGLGLGAWVLVNTYIPELLFPENEGGGIPLADAAAGPGSRVNISVGDTSGAALPSASGDGDEVGNITDLISGAVDPAAEARAARPALNGQGIDQKPEDNYTKREDPAADFSGGADSASFSGDFGEMASGSDSFGLPDLGSLSGAFSAGGGGPGSRDEAVVPSLPERKPSGNKPEKFEGDFNPKEIAAGIRTVLEKDKKG